MNCYLSISDYMYISANMANLQKCSRCKSTIDVSYFSLNRKNEYFKTCNTCRTKSRESRAKQRQQLDVEPSKRTDTDFVDEDFDQMKNNFILSSWRGRCAKRKKNKLKNNHMIV